MRGSTGWQIAAFVLGIATVAGLVLYVGAGEIARTAQGASLSLFGAAFLAYALFFVLRGIRWSILLEPVARVPQGTTASLSAAGWLVSSFIPFKAGDVGRTALLARRDELGLAAVGGTVAVERALDMIGVALAASLGLLTLAWIGSNQLPPVAMRAVAVAWVAPLLALLGLWALGRFVDEADNQLANLARSFRQGLQGLVEQRSRWTPVAVLTALVTLAQTGIFVLLFLAFQPAAPLLLVVAAVPVFLLSFAISVTPGNVGTYEAAFVAVFALFGFSTTSLASLAVLVHLSTTLFVIVLGSLGFGWYMAARPHGSLTTAPEVDA